MTHVMNDVSVRWDHLVRLSDTRGIFEHALGTERRIEHGYCADDNARLLALTSRGPDTGVVRRLNRTALRFVLDSQDADGQVRNRVDADGHQTDYGTVEDCWGRCLFALGETAARHSDATIRLMALHGFNKGVHRRSPWKRSMIGAALGAAEVFRVEPRHDAAAALMRDTLAMIGDLRSETWQWPEARLAYANATMAEAVIAIGHALNESVTIDKGVQMLRWLLDRETAAGHLSVAPAGGCGPEDKGPMFDQQPIEVSAMADACWRAGQVTGDPSWQRGILAARDWFGGANDSEMVMFDPVSGGGYDGLERDGVNLNQGAESTLAYVSTMQRATPFATADEAPASSTR